jgi:hypothetical protein
VDYLLIDALLVLLLIDALLVLLPKKDDPNCIGDYRPISLILGRFFPKPWLIILLWKLAVWCPPIQSAFIKGHNIHDNSCYVQATTKTLASTKSP